MLHELERKASEIRASEDFLRNYSLEAGLRMSSGHRVENNPERLEALIELG